MFAVQVQILLKADHDSKPSAPTLDTMDMDSCSIAINISNNNFVRIHKTLRMTPAMAAGLTDRLWESERFAKLVGGCGSQAHEAGALQKAARLAGK